jgi:hypothetical protein
MRENVLIFFCGIFFVHVAIDDSSKHQSLPCLLYGTLLRCGGTDTSRLCCSSSLYDYTEEQVFLSSCLRDLIQDCLICLLKGCMQALHRADRAQSDVLPSDGLPS